MELVDLVGGVNASWGKPRRTKLVVTPFCRCSSLITTWLVQVFFLDSLSIFVKLSHCATWPAVTAVPQGREVVTLTYINHHRKVLVKKKQTRNTACLFTLSQITETVRGWRSGSSSFSLSDACLSLWAFFRRILNKTPNQDGQFLSPWDHNQGKISHCYDVTTANILRNEASGDYVLWWFVDTYNLKTQKLSVCPTSQIRHSARDVMELRWHAVDQYATSGSHSSVAQVSRILGCNAVSLSE